jgi:hypothetical protein
MEEEQNASLVRFYFEFPLFKSTFDAK